MTDAHSLIAIMLGRLHMTDDECIETFRAWSESVFGHHRLIRPPSRPKYSERVLYQATKRIIDSFDPSAESEKWKRNIFAASDESCKW